MPETTTTLSMVADAVDLLSLKESLSSIWSITSVSETSGVHSIGILGSSDTIKPDWMASVAVDDATIYWKEGTRYEGPNVAFRVAGKTAVRSGFNRTHLEEVLHDTMITMMIDSENYDPSVVDPLAERVWMLKTGASSFEDLILLDEVPEFGLVVFGLGPDATGIYTRLPTAHYTDELSMIPEDWETYVRSNGLLGSVYATAPILGGPIDAESWVEANRGRLAVGALGIAALGFVGYKLLSSDKAKVTQTED